MLGYAYTGPFVGRAAYDWGAETSIYLRRDCRHQGLGKALYTALAGDFPGPEYPHPLRLHRLSQAGGPVSDPNSAQFHAHLGFRLVGTFEHCGRKFDRWYDMIWMEKQLSPCRNPRPR